MSTALPPDDPYGDRAWQEERKRRRDQGRSAILDGAIDWKPDDTPPAGDAGEGDGETPPGPPPEEEISDVVMIPRFFGKTVRMVPISLPDPCPITPLGKDKRLYYYLSPLGELVELADSEHGQAHIEALWAPKIGELHKAFPQFNQQRQFKGFQAQYARPAMTNACALKGLFDPQHRVRGLGCWTDDDGQLIQHLGDRILIGDAEHRPGEIGKYVYVARTRLSSPAKAGRADAEQVYDHFRSWNFARGDLDARLLLGQVCSSILGGALEWRPMAFLTGDAATGKSTLQRLIRGMLPGRLVPTVDATEAALRALLGNDSVGVSFDEIEADALNDKAQNVMKLARTAASGDDAHRSSSSQQLRGFTLRGAFLFSAIIPPSMRQQDMQRFAFLRLMTLKAGSRPPSLKPAEQRQLGDALVGRITEAWPRWQRTLECFVAELEARGHANRGAMQFGTLLAAAHVVLEDREPNEEDFARWCDPLKRDGLFEYENSEPAWLQAWRRLLSAQPEVWRSDGFPTVAEMVRRYLVAEGRGQDGEEERRKVHDKLTRSGLAIVKQRVTGRMFLAIPPRHQAVAAIYAGSDFQARGGEGAWTIPMRGADKIEGEPHEHRGVLHVEKVPRLDRQKCTLYWLDGRAMIGGVWTPIFDRKVEDDEIAGPMEARVEAYRAALRKAKDRDELIKVRELGLALRDELDADTPDGSAELDQEFADRWEQLG